MATVIDFAAAFPSADAVKGAGHDGVVAYVSPARAVWMGAKPLTKTVADAYRDAGLGVACVWQYGGADAPDVMRGEAGGRADALAADKALVAAGLAGHPVFFAVDFAITLDQWNTTVVEYFRGAVAVLGRQRVGIYGHSRVVAWAQQDQVVADLGSGRCLGWVTSSWSQGDKATDYAVLYQGVHNVPGPDGVQVDINTVYAPEWGHRAIPAPAVDLTKLPHIHETVWMNKHFNSGRWWDGRNRTVEYITRHHMGGIGDAHQCYQWWQTRRATAHYAVDKNGKVGQLVREEDTAWSNADPASNAVSIAIEHSNCAGPDQDWPIASATITAGAHLAAELCLKHNLGRPEFGKNIRDHCEFGATACPYHLRFGQKYHDQWMRAAQDHYDTLTKPAAPAAQEDDMFTDSDREALLDCRAMLQTLCAQDMGDPGVTGPYEGWPHDQIMASVREKLAAGKDLTRTEQMHALADKAGIYKEK